MVYDPDNQNWKVPLRLADQFAKSSVHTSKEIVQKAIIEAIE
jgi:hypothetical protein